MKDLKHIVRQQIDAINKKKMDAFRRVTAPGAVYENYAAMQYGDRAVKGVEAWVEHLQAYYASFEVRGEIISQHLVGEHVVLSYIDWSGKHTGPLPMGGDVVVPPTGKSAVVNAAYWTEIKDGQVAYAKQHFNWLDVLVQLGLV